MSASRDHEPSIGSALEGRERPILFSAPMVRALLAGTKTQTRRIVKPQPHHGPVGTMVHLGDGAWAMDDGDLSGQWQCPYGVPGDRLWVKETWQAQEAFDRLSPSAIGDAFAEEYGEPWRPIRYLSDGKCEGSVEQWQESPAGKTRVSIHMPRWASRITLEITDVRVDRLNDISEADALAEGSQEPSLVPIIGACWFERDAYAKLWEHINGPGSWAEDPWVWCVSFERLGPLAEREGSRQEGASGARPELPCGDAQERCRVALRSGGGRKL